MLETDRRAIEIDFLRSWDIIEVFFGEDYWLTPLLPLIKTLRARGYDRQLRAGQSMNRFILSRSREHGLRPDQPSLIFSLTRAGGMVVDLQGSNVSMRLMVDQVGITPEIENLFVVLLAHPID